MAIGGVSFALTGNEGPTTKPAAAADKQSQPDRESLEKRASRGKARPTGSASPDSQGKQGSDAAKKDDGSVHTAVTGDSGSCKAVYTSTGSTTASGQKFDANAMTAGNMTLPIGTKVQLTNPSNGKSVTVKINDRGPYSGDSCFLLTSGAYAKIASLDSDTATVDYQVLY
ncbi:septal ring lytic transglycosylase RlpA family protein [Actinocatenispora thailandica]|nr:septal ring lytic transglycosylase RlpA family protein [Actinocatenispora thailandica]